MATGNRIHRWLSRRNYSPQAVTQRVRQLSELGWLGGGEVTAAESDLEPEWLRQNLARGLVHDPDYWTVCELLSESTNPLVLDVGANYGYTVTSLRSAGYQHRIWSFEPLALHDKALNSLIDLYPETFTWSQTALSDTDDVLELRTPVICGHAITALTFSVDDPPSAEALSELLVTHAQVHLHMTLSPDDVGFVRSTSPCARLADVVSSSLWWLEADRVLIKIDVEGQERRVLAGAEGLLTDTKAAFLVEGVNASPRVQAWFAEHSFVVGDVRAGEVVTGQPQRASANALYVPASWV